MTIGLLPTHKIHQPTRTSSPAAADWYTVVAWLRPDSWARVSPMPPKLLASSGSG